MIGRNSIRHGICIPAALIACVLAAPAGAVPVASAGAATSAAAPTQTTETSIDRLRRAADLLESGEHQAADAILRGLIAEPGFEGYSDEFKFATYTLAAGAALYLNDADRGAAMLEKAVASPEANAEVASAALELALEQGRPERAIPAMKVLAVQAPAKIQELDSRVLYQMHSEFVRQKLPYPARIDFLRALFDANRLVEDGRQPSSLWRVLVEMYLAQGDTEAAALVAQRITAPNDLIALQIDRRFDGIVARLDPARLDVKAALARETAIIRSAIAREPRMLQHVVELTYVLLDAGSYQELLDVCDAVLAKVDAAKKDAPAFDDMDHALPWIQDNRARALLGVGRIDEAVAVFDAARRMPENGGANTSQAINIARLFATLDRPREALDALVPVEDASPYGWMQYHLSRLLALHATPDAPLASESLAYLREHRDDAPGALIEALIRLGATEEASTAFRARIADPDERSAALVAAQRFVSDAVSPRSAAWIAQSNAFYARPEIVAAIESFGRLIPIPLHQQEW